MDLPEEAKRAPSAPVWNQSFPSPGVVVANLLLSPTVKKFLKLANISKVIKKISSGTFFMAHCVVVAVTYCHTACWHIGFQLVSCGQFVVVMKWNHSSDTFLSYYTFLSETKYLMLPMHFSVIFLYIWHSCTICHFCAFIRMHSETVLTLFYW